MEEQQSFLRNLIKAHGEDPNREGLKKTPQRFLKSFEYLTSGYRQDAAKVLKSATFNEAYKDMVIVRNIEFYSLCEHHLLPFYGKCDVGYIPNGKVVGLSKIPRVVNIFSRRLQLQERLTNQICEEIFNSLEPLGVGVVMHAYHFCMMMRGVEKQSSSTTTSAVRGCFTKLETREEFMSHLRNGSL